jgi:multiple sugar transport system substrate-binding protein
MLGGITLLKRKTAFSLTVAVLVGASMAVTGCSNSPKEANAATSEPITLRFFSTNGQAAKGEFLYRRIEDFTKANPNIKVDVSYANGVDWTNAFSTMASSNDLPDIIQPSTDFTLQDLIANKWVQPLEGLVSKDFKNTFPEGTFVNGITMDKGKIYSFPRIISINGPVLAYNRKLLKEAGLDPDKPPKTWDELLEMSKKVTEAGKGQYYGLELPLAVKDGPAVFLQLASALQPTLNANGFDYQKGQYDFASDSVTKAFEFFFKLKDAGVIDPNSINNKSTDAASAFQNNKAAFYVNAAPIVRTSHVANPNLDFDVTSLPSPDASVPYRFLTASTTNSTSSFITSTTKHSKEAAKLIEWISSPEYYQKQLKEDYLLSPIPSLNKDPNNYPADAVEKLKHLNQALESTAVIRPMPETKDSVFEVSKTESTISKPKPDWWEVLQGAYVGKIKDWKSELVKVNDTYNKRFEQAIKKAQDKGIQVSKQDFTFPDFDGKKNYKTSGTSQ